MPQQNELKDLFSQGRYNEVITFWGNPDEVAAFSEWDFLHCMNSLYKLKRYEDCLEVYRACIKKFPDFDRLDDKMGWSLYYVKIRNFNFQQGDVAELLKRIDFIFEHSSNTRYSPRWRLAKFVADAVKAGKLGNEVDHSLTLKYLSKIDPSQLDDAEDKLTDSSGRTRALPSDRESWYSLTTQLLLKQNSYEACIACCDQAMTAVARFHNNNEIWFRYRKAKCLCAMNRVNEAKLLVEKILSRGGSHWCLYQLMSEIEAVSENTDQALRYAGTCALSDPKHQMRVSFYANLADYLDRINETEAAMLLRRLVLLIREENGWKTKNSQAQWQFLEEIAALDKKKVLSRLQPIWRHWRDKDKTFYEGTVEKLLAEGQSGFICGDNGNQYYFSARDLQSRVRNLQTGMRVRFSLADRLDKKKGVVKPNAVDITVL